MSEELELLSDYLREGGATPVQLDGARSVLDQAIRSEMERSHAPGREPEHGHRDRRRPKLHRNVLIAAVVALVVAAVPILLTFSKPKNQPHLAAAAKISQLADVVRPTHVLAPGQWSSLQLTGELLASVGSVGSTKTPDAVASVPVTIGVWSNSTGTTCTSQQFGTAMFASPVNAQAWTSIGLIATPVGQPATGCVAGVQATTGGSSAMTPLNVSQLSHDPTVLAQELQLGTTGVDSWIKGWIPWIKWARRR